MNATATTAPQVIDSVPGTIRLRGEAYGRSQRDAFLRRNGEMVYRTRGGHLRTVAAPDRATFEVNAEIIDEAHAEARLEDLLRMEHAHETALIENSFRDLDDHSPRLIDAAADLSPAHAELRQLLRDVAAASVAAVEAGVPVAEVVDAQRAARPTLDVATADTIAARGYHDTPAEGGDQRRCDDDCTAAQVGLTHRHEPDGTIVASGTGGSSDAGRAHSATTPSALAHRADTPHPADSRDFDVRLAHARAVGHWPDGRPFDQCINPIPTTEATGSARMNCGRCRYRVRYVGTDVHHMRWEHTAETWREPREDEQPSATDHPADHAGPPLTDGGTCSDCEQPADDGHPAEPELIRRSRPADDHRAIIRPASSRFIGDDARNGAEAECWECGDRIINHPSDGTYRHAAGVVERAHGEAIAEDQARAAVAAARALEADQ